MSEQFHSIGTAARLLGLSVSTIKRLADEGLLQAVRTEAGHRRIPGEAIQSYKARLERGPTQQIHSPTIQHRREVLEGKKLDLEEASLDDQLGKIRAYRRARARARREEREREQESAEARIRQEEIEAQKLARQDEQERKRADAARRERAFQEKWTEICISAVSVPPVFPWTDGERQKKARIEQARKLIVCGDDLSWLTDSQRRELSGALEQELKAHSCEDEPLMARKLSLVARGSVEPWKALRAVQIVRHNITEETLRSLPLEATKSEQVRAKASIREAFAGLPLNAERDELEVTAAKAIDPIRNEIVEREERRQLQTKKESLIFSGVLEVDALLKEMHDAGEIDREAYHDYEFVWDLKKEVRDALGEELEGDEDLSEVRERVRELIDSSPLWH